ncbi:MAG: tRNA (adenosine(37)-N6)-dimethylallyltransferase MiaA [Alphaproteobacteria bacterium]|nr:tRNA (adenosine(37)-N6)-dimethylallyltransferase MiaA [Alphaproteobacteria bacterium]
MSDHDRRAGKVVVIAGPTASGKSAAALELAAAHDGVVINADAMQVYRDLPILTAAPDAAARGVAPHELYGVLDGAERCSAARWRDLAVAAIDAALARDVVPVVTGGTGLYLKALMQGLAPVPRVPGEVTRASEALFDRLGGQAFHRRLIERDPETAALAPRDRQRQLRAWAVLEATGKSLAHWQRQPVVPVPYRFDANVIVPPRNELYAACDARFAAMVAGGAAEEVAALLDRGLDGGLPVMKSLGVKELAAALAGEIGLDAAIAAGQQATRRYAKRQMTWFRHQLGTARLISNYREIAI